MFRFTSSAPLIAALAFSMPASAEDTGLYAEAAPDDASFVRFVGFEPGVAEFSGHNFEIPDDTPNTYIAVSSAQLNDVAAGSYVTVVRTDTGAVSHVTEQTRKDRSKVHLFMINAADTVRELRLADGSMDVISDVAPGQAGTRAVNPVSVSLGVFDEDSTAPLATFDVTLRRGQNLSFVANGDTITMIENAFGPVSH